MILIKKKCALPPEINNCHYFTGKDDCLAPHDNCGMLDKHPDATEPTGYVRKERWYEKYYK